MKNGHATDLEIQKYAFDRGECENSIVVHIGACAACTESVQAYLTLTANIKEQPGPVLEYDLAKLVMDRLPADKAVETSNDFLTNIVMLTIGGFILLALFLFIQTIAFLLDNTLIYKSIFIISSIGCISAILVFDLYKSFQRKIKMLKA